MNSLIVDETTLWRNGQVKGTTEEASVLLKHAPSSTVDFVCLNFKVPLRIRQEFKACAARRNMTMTDLLLQLLDGCLKHDESNSGQRLLE
jgi:hypothetical protein